MNRIIKLIAIISLLFNIYTSYASIETNINPSYATLDPQLFVETTAKIEPFTVKSEKTDELTNGYNITYNVTESNAKNQDNQEIKGEITQRVFFNDKQKVTKEQEVQIKYEKAEPMMYHYKKLLELES